MNTVTPKIIAIEGNIGSGKSTLVSNMEDAYKNDGDYYFLQEPVNIWNTIKDENGITILERFYAETEKFAFQFQMMAYISRLSLLRDALKNKKIKYIITERSIYTDANVFAKMLYDDKKISLIEYTIYKKWFDEFVSEVPVTKVIYVKTEPEIAHERVIIRNRTGEHIPIEYLKQCHKYHEDWLTTENYDQLTLDGNVNIYENPNVVSDWLSKIRQFIVPNNIDYVSIAREYTSLMSPNYDNALSNNSRN
jgi:deoxyadenosine/deoxycytidine kinase